MKQYLLNMGKILIGFISLFFLNEVLAQSLGGVASGALVPVKVAGGMVEASSQFLGVCLLIASVIRYSEHRKRPVQVKLSTPVLFFIFGAFLVTLPYLATFSEATKAVGHEHKHVPDVGARSAADEEAAFIKAQLEAQKRAAERKLEQVHDDENHL